MHDDHCKLTLTTSFILQRIKTFLVFLKDCIPFHYGYTILYTNQSNSLKEVIRPQVPLRPPCYDFSLVADPRFDDTN
jgi:hypothetical protein